MRDGVFFDREADVESAIAPGANTPGADATRLTGTEGGEAFAQAAGAGEEIDYGDGMRGGRRGMVGIRGKRSPRPSSKGEIEKGNADTSHIVLRICVLFTSTPESAALR